MLSTYVFNTTSANFKAAKGFGPQTAMTPGKTGINLPNNIFFRNLAWTLWAPIGFTTASIEALE